MYVAWGEKASRGEARDDHKNDEAGNRGDVDDVAMPAPPHTGQDSAGYRKQAKDVRLELIADFLLFRLLYR